MEANTDFLPQGYETPKGNSSYMKLEKGDNKFRIMSKPLLGWVDWDDKKPVRFKMADKPTAPIDPKKPLKHFWAMIVWDYKAEQVRILELTQNSIQSAIKGLVNDADWGAPYSYDIKVVRTGDGMDTEYQVNPVPHKPMSNEMMNAFIAKPIQLDLLITGEDPFAPKGTPTTLESHIDF
jgi:hypothetical protein